jgi:hypothetical protein
MTTPFWTNEPTILFDKEGILQLWPTQQMSFESKLNAITRLIIIMTILGFIFTGNKQILFISVITLGIMFKLYRLRKEQIVGSLVKNKKEGFSNNKIETAMTTNPVTLESVLRSDFHPTHKKNPFGNVLLTDIMDKPNRKAAAPSFNPDVYEEIDKAVRKQTQMLNPGIINTTKQIYGDLKDQYDLDNSMMRFYSTANTRVENDSSAFSKWLYGSMYSGKESTPEGAMMRVKDNVRYLLI